MNVEKFHQYKIKLLSTILLVFFLLTVFFLIRWQVIESEKYKVLADQRVSEEKIPSIRGAILARDESTLAFSEPRFDIYAYVPEITNAETKKKQTKEEFIKKVGEVLGDENKVREKVNSGQNWVKIADKVTYDTKNVLFALHPDCCEKDSLIGLRYELNSMRLYPEADLASHVVGFVGQNFNGTEVGRGGIEQFREGILSPQEGFDFSEKDSLGNIITISGSDDPIEARRGSTIVTTIDKTIQQKVEQELKKGIERYKAKGGTTIVMDPKTGEILAMATYPDFDPNKYFEVEDGTVFRNNSISLPYEIGSVMKAVTMAAAVDMGAVEPDTIVVESHKGCEHLLEQREVCTYDKKPQGTITAVEALIKSDNIALYHTAKLIGQEKFYDYLKKFGVGSTTGIDLAGESYNSIPDGKTWNLADLATYSYGHSYQVTPIQAITAVAALANDGKLMQPYIVSKIIDGEEVKEFNPVVVTQAVKPETADVMMGMLNEVYKSNIKEQNYLRAYGGYKLGMKSGTALIPCALVPEVGCSGYSSEYNATYVGFDGSDDRTFIMIVKLERPELTSPKYNLSYYNARSIWLDTFNEIKDYLQVPKAAE